MSEEASCAHHICCTLKMVSTAIWMEYEQQLQQQNIWKAATKKSFEKMNEKKANEPRMNIETQAKIRFRFINSCYENRLTPMHFMSAALIEFLPHTPRYNKLSVHSLSPPHLPSLSLCVALSLFSCMGNVIYHFHCDVLYPFYSFNTIFYCKLILLSNFELKCSWRLSITRNKIIIRKKCCKTIHSDSGISPLPLSSRFQAVKIVIVRLLEACFAARGKQFWSEISLLRGYLPLE